MTVLVGAVATLLVTVVAGIAGARIQAWFELIRWRRTVRMDVYAEFVRLMDRAGGAAHLGPELTNQERVELQIGVTTSLAPVNLVAPPELFALARSMVEATVAALAQQRGNPATPRPAFVAAWVPAHRASQLFVQTARLDLGIDQPGWRRQRRQRSAG